MKRPDWITIISIYHYFVAGLFVLGLCVMIAVPFIVAAAPDADAAAAVPIVAIVTVIAVFILLIFAAGFGVIGWGLWTLKPWARMGAIVLAGLSLLSVPIGTIIGGLTLWYLFQPEARAAFGEVIGPKAE
jgi:hypothetical protein